jgi:site-specific DNA-methyltransferase (adenine-specific)
LTVEIWHGDSTILTPQIGGPVHCVVTDHPYGMAFKSGSAQTAAGKKWVEEIENDGDLEQAIGTFIAAMLPLMDKFPDDADMYVFTRWNMTQAWTDAINGALDPFVVKNVLIWDKGTPGMGDVEANWGFSYEPILYAKKGRRPIPHRRSSIISKIDRTPSSAHIHPTQKPVELIEVLLQMSTNSGDLVVDPFSGSGSTIVAAERLGRNAIGIELKEEFVNRAKQRLGQNLLDLGI